MKRLVIYFYALIVLVILSCAGTTEPESDQEEAFVADLIEHTGDTGDIIKNSHGIITDTLNCYYGSDSTYYEMENNGIDAYFEGDWILVPWHHISDPKTVSLELFRFSYMDYQNHVEDSVSLVEFIPFNSSTRDYYIDTFEEVDDAIDQTWFYFLKTTNSAGATAYSDTIGYHLINKPVLRSPSDHAEFTIADSLIFEWDVNTNSSLVKNRLLVFDDSYHLIWFYNLLSDEEPLIDFKAISGIELEPGDYIWRVDGIIEWINELELDGTTKEVYSGSESMERTFTVTLSK